MSNHQLYDQDFYAWTNEQAGLLRAGRLSEADVEHIAEEIENMGKSEKRELVSRLRVLLLHLLKWQYQPSRRGKSWKASIINTRDELEVHLADNPSLKSFIPVALTQAYRYAVRDAEVETGFALSTFPQSCPWTDSEIMDPDFWPDPPVPHPSSP
jgi:Domain of unknown function DUF29